MSLVPAEQEVNGFMHLAVIDLPVQVFIDPTKQDVLRAIHAGGGIGLLNTPYDSMNSTSGGILNRCQFSGDSGGSF